MTVYCCTVTYWAAELLDFFYKGKYTAYNAVVGFFCIYIFLNYLAKPSEFYFYLSKQPKLIFSVRLFSSLGNIIICYPLVKFFGIFGGTFGYIAGQFMMTSGLILIMIRKKKIHFIKGKRHDSFF
jgi:O-antigen/teichoic acid export membrane protein